MRHELRHASYTCHFCHLLCRVRRYELVVFTASLSKYANPLMDLLDKNRVVRARLFREHCVQHDGSYVKDLSRLGRSLRSTIIVDNSPHAYAFQPSNAVAIGSFINDRSDCELRQLVPYLNAIAGVADVRKVLGNR